MKSKQTVPIIRPQSNSSRTPQSQKKRPPAKVLVAQKLPETKKPSINEPKLTPESNDVDIISNSDNILPKQTKSKIPKRNIGNESKPSKSNFPKQNLEPQSKEIHNESKKSNLDQPKKSAKLTKNPKPNESKLDTDIPKPVKNTKPANKKLETDIPKPAKNTKLASKQLEADNSKQIKNTKPVNSIKNSKIETDKTTKSTKSQISKKETPKQKPIPTQEKIKPNQVKKDDSTIQNKKIQSNDKKSIDYSDSDEINDQIDSSSSSENQIDYHEIESNLNNEIPSYSEIINNEPKTESNTNEFNIDNLDDILMEVQDWNSDFLSLNFTKYHQLTEKLFECIKSNQFNSQIENFKAAAICVKITPSSDKEILTMSLSILHKMANQSNSNLFVDCNIIESLVKIAFSNKEINTMSKLAANILNNISSDNKVKYGLLQYDCISMIAKCISTQTSRERFNSDYSSFVVDCLSILIVLCEKTSDFSKYSKFLIPLTLLNLLTIFKENEIIQNKISVLFRVLLDFDENIEILECEDLSPLFTLIDSNNKDTVENAIYAISNGVQISDSFVDTIAELEEPLGIVQLCNQLKKGSFELNVEILKSLVKLTSFKQGAMEALQNFNKIAMFLDIDLNECMNSPNGQSEIVYAMKILKNFAYLVPDRVAAAVDGKLRFVCSIGAVQIVVELAKIIVKTETGKTVLGEVRDMPQIASLF